MDCEEGMELETEYYDVSEIDIFQNIVNQRVLDVEMLLVSDGSAIGVKLIFENDFVLSTPINDGNTVETNFFNKSGNLKNLKPLGEIRYKSLLHT